MNTLGIFLCVVLLGSVALAETIHFKDGRSVSGKILEKNAQSIKVDLNGLTMTYYADEIKDIDGQLMTLASAAPTPTPISAGAVEIPAVKRALILKFIDVFGTRVAMTQNFEAMLQSLAEQKPEEAVKIRDRVKMDEIIQRLIPLYDKHFSAEELKAYIDFYSSDKGQKLVSSIGAIMKESIEVSAQYFREKFPEIGQNQ